MCIVCGLCGLFLWCLCVCIIMDFVFCCRVCDVVIKFLWILMMFRYDEVVGGVFFVVVELFLGVFGGVIFLDLKVEVYVFSVLWLCV